MPHSANFGHDPYSLAPFVPADAQAGAPVSANIERALNAWKRALGSKYVLNDSATRNETGQTTLPGAPGPIAVIQPSSTAEVATCLRIAQQWHVPLYPISRGKNWGYGDRCAVRSGQVLLDLQRMTRIHEFNEELGYAVIEPGVSQGQLYQEILNRESGLMLDVTGAGPDASVVGNALERGFGHTPYGDHFAHCAGMEVVLPDGSILQTGFGAFANAQSTAVFPTGLGPTLDGLFSQSNFGVVTSMTVWLMRRPERIKAFAVRLSDDSQLERAIDILRELCQHNYVQSTVHVANDLRVMSALTQCPARFRRDKTALDDATRKELQKSTATGAWNLLGALYGDRPAIDLAKREITKRLIEFGRPVFFDRQTIRRWELMAAPLSKSKRFAIQKARLASATSALDLLSGIPTKEHLKGAFWRNGTAVDHKRCDPIDAGLIWISPVLPMTGDHARAVMNHVEPLMQKHGFDPLVTLTAINSRALCGVISINFDRRDPEQCDRAQACYASLWTTLVDAGYLPYRCGVQSMEKVGQANENRSLLNRLKHELDPAGILAPGRYGIG